MDLEFDHVAVLVQSLAESTPALERLTGTASSPAEEIPSQRVRVCFVGSVELIEPTSPDTGVARYLEKRGPGLHHIAYRVDDVGSTVNRLTSEGYRFTSDEPMVGRGGHRVAFLHPSSTGGVLIEFVERPRNPTEEAELRGPESASTPGPR